MKSLAIALAAEIIVASITAHEFVMFPPGMTATPAPVTEESTHKEFQLPAARQFTLISRSA